MSEITIRTARLDDASKLVSIYRYYVEKTAITFEYEVPTVAEFRRRMGTTMQKISCAVWGFLMYTPVSAIRSRKMNI